MSELPQSWIDCQLGDVVEYGKTIKAEPNEIPADTWLLELEDIEKDTSKILQRHTFAQRQSKSTKNRFYAGDVLYGKLRPYLNKVVRADQDGYCTTEIIPLPSSRWLDGSYLFYWLKHPEFLDYVTSVSHGLNMPRLGTEAGNEAPFVLAPLNEQKRIADKLDAVLARVDACRERLDRVPAILKRFRQSVLAAATSGKLTEEWRENSGGRSQWARPMLYDLIVDGPKNGIYKPASAYGVGTRILRIDNFYDGFTRPWSELKRLQVNDKERTDYGLEVGDIVINRVNSLTFLGKAALIRELPEECVFESNMMRIRVDLTRVSPEYAILVLTSPYGVEQLRRNAKHAVNQASINQSDVGGVEFPLPSVTEQREIVRRVEELFVYADRLEARYAAGCAQVERLTPVLLAKAFRGELVPQDPSDEPASALLERIRAQRATTPKPARGRRKREAAEALPKVAEPKPEYRKRARAR